MKIQFNSNYGQFKTQLEATVPDGSNHVICEEGLANILYRVAGSNVDKSFGLKKGDKRSEVEYSTENAKDVTDAVVAKITELATVNDEGTNEGDAADYASLHLEFAVTGQHIINEAASPMARATALVDTFLGTPMETPYRAIFTAQGMKGSETASRETLIEFAHSKGLGVQLPKGKK